MASFWDKRAADRQLFGDKELLTESRTPFHITDVKRVEGGKFGAQWVLHCTALAGNPQLNNGDVFNIGLSANDYRDNTMAELQAAIADGEIVEAIMESFETKGGNTAFDIAPVPDDVAVTPF